MSAELEGIVEDLFEAVDELDVDSVSQFFAEDAQMVEEITRQWTRGKGNVEAAFADTARLISDIHTEVSEFHTVITGETALVTCVLSQNYTYDEAEVEIFAPTTIAFQKIDGEWKITLLHSVPLL